MDVDKFFRSKFLSFEVLNLNKVTVFIYFMTSIYYSVPFDIFDWQTFTTFMSMTTVETLIHRIVLILTSPSFYNPLLQKVQLFRYIISCLRALTFPRGQALWRQEQKKLLPQAKEITFSCVSSLHNKTFFSFF